MEEIVARMASRDIILFDGQNMTGCLDHVRTYVRTYAHTNMHTHADTHTSTPDLSRSGSLSYYKHTPDHTHTHTPDHIHKLHARTRSESESESRAKRLGWWRRDREILLLIAWL